MSEAPGVAMLLELAGDNSKLLRSMEASVAKFDKASNDVEARGRKFAKNTEDAFGAPNIGKALERTFSSARLGVLEEGSARLRIFGSALEPLGGLGIAAAGGVAAFALSMDRTEKAVKFASDIEHLAEVVGVSTDFIQKFNFALGQNDIEVSAGDEALKKFNVTLGAVKSGLARQQQVKAFAAVGFTPADLRQYRDAGELFPVLATRIAAIGDASERAAIAKRLGIEELISLLNQGALGFDALAKKAEDLGIVMDASTIQKAAEAERKLKELDEVMKAKANVTFAEFADTLIAVKEAFLAAEVAALSFLAAITNTQSAKTKMEELRATIASGGFSDAASTPEAAAYAVAAAKKELNGLELKSINDQLKAADKAAKERGGPAKQLVPDKAPGAKSDQTLNFDKAAQDAYAAGLKALTAAQASLLIDVQQRATAEKAAVFHDLASKIADLDVEEEKIRKSKNDSHKASQLALIETAKSDQINAAHARAEEIDRKTAETLRQQALATAQQQLDGQAQLVQLAQGLTFSDTLRQKYALELVNLAYRRTQIELEGIIASKTASEADKKIAQLKLDQLNAQHPLEVEGARRNGSQGAQSANSIVAGIKQQDSRVEQERNAYAEIDRLRQTDVISEREAQQAKYAVAAQYNEARLQQASGFFGNLATLSESSNKTLSAIGKAAAIAQATIDGILAVQKALASAPPPFNFAIAAAVGVAAAVNVAKIAGFEEGGYTGPGDRKKVAGVVHGEEYVIKASATARNLPLLEAINAGRDLSRLLPAPNVSALAAGGPVGGGDTHNHIDFSPQISNPEPDLARILERQPRVLALHLERLIRNGDIRLSPRP